MERVEGIEPSSPAWKAGVIAFIRYPQAIESLHEISQFDFGYLQNPAFVQVFYRLRPCREGANYSALKQKVQSPTPGRQGTPRGVESVLAVAREFFIFSSQRTRFYRALSMHWIPKLFNEPV